MKILIIYKSKTGFTKKYAEWIREETDAEIIPFKRKNKVSLNFYDTIIFGAPFHAGKISGLNWLKKKLPELKNKKIIVFATGASPAQDEEIKKAFSVNFDEEDLKKIKPFYFQSGLNYEKMGGMDKLLMKIYAFMLKKTEGESEAYKMIRHSYDISSKELIIPLTEYIRSNS